MKRIKVKLGKEERVQLEELQKKVRDHKSARRLLCIRLLDDGKINTEVADFLGVSLETIKNWLVIYEESGLQGLSALHYGKKQSCLFAYKDEIYAYINENIISDVWQVVDYVNNELGMGVGYSAVIRFIKKNSILLARNQREYHLRQRRNLSRKNLREKCTN